MYQKHYVRSPSKRYSCNMMSHAIQCHWISSTFLIIIIKKTLHNKELNIWLLSWFSSSSKFYGTNISEKEPNLWTSYESWFSFSENIFFTKWHGGLCTRAIYHWAASELTANYTSVSWISFLEHFAPSFPLVIALTANYLIMSRGNFT